MVVARPVSYRTSRLACHVSAFMSAASCWLFGPGAGLRFLAMLLGEHGGRRSVGSRRLLLVLESRNDLVVALLHRFETELRNARWIGFLLLPDLRIEQARSLEERRLGGARHQARDGDTAV